jgi:radical SAM protein with 4Fe4S-binding SPASM domain
MAQADSSPTALAPRYPRSLVFEVTQRCNHECLHCYNVWKNRAPYPRGELSTADTIALLTRVLDETGIREIALSGGEPLLRPDFGEIFDFLAGRGVAMTLITNGSLLDERAVARYATGAMATFELPLLAADREIHDRLSGAPGAFDRATAAMAELRLAGAAVVGVFVATRLNLPGLAETLELAAALGLDAVMFNRMNPGGAGVANLELLQATPAELEQALETLEAASAELELPVACAIPMPPCLIRTERFGRLSFGFCGAGTEHSYFTIDPLGHLRPCNHSPTILGDLAKRTFAELAASPAMAAFSEAHPDFCAGCGLERTCLGGCKAAAEAACGSIAAMDPFLAAFCGGALKPRPRP